MGVKKQLKQCDMLYSPRERAACRMGVMSSKCRRKRFAISSPRKKPRSPDGRFKQSYKKKPCRECKKPLISFSINI